MCGQVVRGQVVCGQVVCVCVRKLCVGGGREQERAGGSAQPKTRTPHKDVGNIIIYYNNNKIIIYNKSQ